MGILKKNPVGATLCGRPRWRRALHLMLSSPLSSFAFHTGATTEGRPYMVNSFTNCSRVSMKRLFSFLFILTVCVISASAQSGASIAGSVVDQNKDAVAGALVKITNLTSGLVITDKTGAAGEYLISGLPSGSYRVTIDRD